MNSRAGHQRQSHASVQGWEWVVFHRPGDQDDGKLTNHYEAEREEENILFHPMVTIG